MTSSWHMKVTWDANVSQAQYLNRRFPSTCIYKDTLPRMMLITEATESNKDNDARMSGLRAVLSYDEMFCHFVLIQGSCLHRPSWVHIAFTTHIPSDVYKESVLKLERLLSFYSLQRKHMCVIASRITGNITVCLHQSSKILVIWAGGPQWIPRFEKKTSKAGSVYLPLFGMISLPIASFRISSIQLRKNDMYLLGEYPVRTVKCAPCLIAYIYI